MSARKPKGVAIEIGKDQIQQGITDALSEAVKTVLTNNNTSFEVRKAVADAVRDSNLPKQIGDGLTAFLKVNAESMVQEHVAALAKVVSGALRVAFTEVFVQVVGSIQEAVGAEVDMDRIRNDIRRTYRETANV